MHFSAFPMTDISIIIVTHNHAPFIVRCLESIQRDSIASAEILVIDNRSDDDSAAIAHRFADVRVEVNVTRRGFASNCNRGMSLAKGRTFVLLNPDTEMHSGSLATLGQFLDAHPDAGLCGPRLVYSDGTPQPSARRFPTWRSVLARRSPARGLLRDSAANRRHLMLDERLDGPTPVDWLLGACLAVTRSTVEKVGPMDEGFPLYVEDIDWARRMHAAGRVNYYIPAATIIHHHQAASDRRLVGRESALHIRSMIRYFRKYHLRRVPLLGITRSEYPSWTGSSPGPKST